MYTQQGIFDSILILDLTAGLQLQFKVSDKDGDTAYRDRADLCTCATSTCMVLAAGAIVKDRALDKKIEDEGEEGSCGKISLRLTL